MNRANWHHFWCNFWYAASCWCGARASLHYKLNARAVIDDINNNRPTKEVS